MAIARHKPDTHLPTKPNLPKVQPDNYKSVIYDDNNVPLTSLISYVEGAPWYGDYYGQVLSKHNDIRELDPGQPNVYQQYQKIVGLEIRVSNPITSSYDTASGITTVIGSGLIYPFITPNINDYFITDVESNKKGIFRITNVERKTFNRDSVYFVDYSLVGYTDVLNTLYNDLVSKVIRNYHFSKDRLIENLQPLLKEEVYQQVSSLKSLYSDLVKYYFTNFFNKKYNTLVIPGQNYAIYDSLLVDYIFKIVDSFDSPEVNKIRKLTTDNDQYLGQLQFWDIMISRDYDMLTMCNQSMKLVTKKIFNTSPFMKGIAFSNIDYVIYPDTPDSTLYLADNPEAKLIALEELIEVKNINGSIADLLTGTYVYENRNINHIHTVLTDEKYVLSNNFYIGSSDQSLLEILTKDYLKHQTINLDQLLLLISKYKSWGRLEQFYYGPILLTLLKEADRSAYT